MVAGGKKNLESYFCWNKFANCKNPIFVWISGKNQRKENDMMEVVWVKEFKLNKLFVPVIFLIHTKIALLYLLGYPTKYNVLFLKE